MSITAFAGPVVSFGQASSGDYNPEIAPSPFIQGVALLDPRAPFIYKPGQDFGSVTAGFGATSMVQTGSFVPATIGSALLAALANVVNGTAMTLVASTGGGITVGVSIINYNTGAVVTGQRAIDTISSQTIGGVTIATNRLAFGSAGTVQLWNPAAVVGRAVSITGSTSGTGGNFTVAGYDAYGVPMTETITVGAGANTVNGKKAFKFISSVTPLFTDAHNYSVGLADVFGLPLRADYVGEVLLNRNTTVITAGTGFVAADTTTATATTGDVRGTYAVQSASDGTKRLIISQTPSIANISSATGLFGVTQA
jgi:hypothetical protein